METTLATILITAAVTAAVISLGVLVWAIAQLRHKVSHLEVLCKGSEREFQGVYNEFDVRNRNHDEKLKDVKNDINLQMIEVWRKFDELQEFVVKQNESVHQRIDRNSDELERNLDKRFDSVYRKLYGSKTTSEVKDLLTS